MLKPLLEKKQRRLVGRERSPEEMARVVRQFDREVQGLIRRGLLLQQADLVRIRKRFSQLVTAAIRDVPRYDLNRAAISTILRDVAEEIDRLTRDLQGIIQRGMQAQEELANRILHTYMEKFMGPGEGIGLISLDPRLMDMAADYSAKLIALREGGLGARMLASVDRELRLAALGLGEGGFLTAGKLVNILGSLRPFHWQGERIYRTEVLRIHSMATQQGIDRLNQQVTTMKRWVWSRIERKEHAAIDGQTVGANGKFTVPLRSGGSVKMRFPRDPSAPGEATINCGCYVVPIPAAAVEQAGKLGIDLKLFGSKAA